MRRTGFTLIELMVAIVLAGVVALLVYGALQAGLDTEQRLAANRHALQAARAMRSLLQDALRNARPALRPGDPAFALEHRISQQGIPLDRLSFVAAGGFPPLTPDADWAVTLEPTAAGLSLVATPVGVRAPQRLAGVLPGVTGLEIRVQAPGGRAGWSDTWPFRSVVPRAVEITYYAEGRPIGLPLVLALPLGGGS